MGTEQQHFGLQPIRLTRYDMIDKNLEVAEFPDEIEIVQLVINPTDEEMNLESEEEETERDEEVPILTTQEAISALKSLVSYVQFKYPENEQFLNAADGLERDINKEILSKRSVQKQITDFFP